MILITTSELISPSSQPAAKRLVLPVESIFNSWLEVPVTPSQVAVTVVPNKSIDKTAPLYNPSPTKSSKAASNIAKVPDAFSLKVISIVFSSFTIVAISITSTSCNISPAFPCNLSVNSVRFEAKVSPFLYWL